MGAEIQLHSLLTSELDGDDEVVRLGGPQSRAGHFGVEGKLLPLGNSKSRLSLSRYTDYATPAPSSKHIRTKIKFNSPFSVNL